MRQMLLKQALVDLPHGLGVTHVVLRKLLPGADWAFVPVAQAE